ncbi:hypothetical protein PV355_38230 [Streptomyces stelliscabiei]|uniref:hypothetical protein n=1 Tax=Streptomyces stelliscabiei TaxID=146820 RepID=UPI0029A7E89B|nr:hypothetical protein [Streptomyces stelliscabiei]MDX2520924.1 hypothetical protein [Streptomyces stelliscabiei]
MHLWQVMCWIAVCGAVGGFAAALLSNDQGFRLPHRVKIEEASVLRPGFIGLVVIGALAAVASWGLYGPVATSTIFGGNATGEPARDNYGITIAAMIGAFLVGVGGSKWLANASDKEVLRAAATTAAGRDADHDIAAKMSTAEPSRIAELAEELPEAEGSGAAPPEGEER